MAFLIQQTGLSPPPCRRIGSRVFSTRNHSLSGFLTFFLLLKETVDEKIFSIFHFVSSSTSSFPLMFWFGTRLCLQSVVCYTLCRRCRENAVAAGEGKAFEAAGKQGCDCMAWSRKRRAGFISRQGVYKSPRPSFHAPTCG